jgi:hypothetical protein
MAIICMGRLAHVTRLQRSPSRCFRRDIAAAWACAALIELVPKTCGEDDRKRGVVRMTDERHRDDPGRPIV